MPNFYCFKQPNIENIIQSSGHTERHFRKPKIYREMCFKITTSDNSPEIIKILKCRTFVISLFAEILSLFLSKIYFRCKVFFYFYLYLLYLTLFTLSTSHLCCTFAYSYFLSIISFNGMMFSLFVFSLSTPFNKCVFPLSNLIARPQCGFKRSRQHGLAVSESFFRVPRFQSLFLVFSETLQIFTSSSLPCYKTFLKEIQISSKLKQQEWDILRAINSFRV